jgi:protocatechuate 3,4-dioxygenase beta subunit
MRLVQFALLVVPLLAAAQQPAGTQPVKPEDKCSIEGQAVNAITGEPVRKAHISLEKGDRQNRADYSATTDAGGRFTIQDIDPGDYSLSAERNGFARLQYGDRGPNRPTPPFTLRAGARVSDVGFRLVPNAVIAGRVLDDDGEPLESVQVGVTHFIFQGGKRQLRPGGGAMTDDLGEYRIFDLEPGKYYLSATYRRQTMMAMNDRGAPDTSEEEGYAPTYFPGTSDPAGAVAIEITAGEVLTGEDLTLRKTRTVRVRGRVTNSMGEGLPLSVILMLMPRNTRLADFSAPLRTRPARNRGGIFEFRGVPPGAYVLMARWSDDGKGYHVKQPIDVGNDSIDGVTVLLTPGLEVKGQIRIDGPAQQTTGRYHVILEAQGPFSMGRTGAPAKEDGSFAIENVSADHYTVNVQGLGENFYVKSMSMGDVDAMETGLDFTNGAAGTVEILLSPNGGQVEGTVADSNQQPAAGATVVLVPDTRHREQSMLFKTATADALGHFNIKGIAPGDYKLFAWQDVESGAYQDPEFLKPYETRGETVAIRESGHATAQLTVLPAESAPGSKSGGN